MPKVCGIKHEVNTERFVNDAPNFMSLSIISK